MRRFGGLLKCHPPRLGGTREFRAAIFWLQDNAAQIRAKNRIHGVELLYG